MQAAQRAPLVYLSHLGGGSQLQSWQPACQCNFTFLLVGLEQLYQAAMPATKDYQILNLKR